MSNDTIDVRVADGRSFSYEGESFGAGEELTVAESTFERHPNTLTAVEDGDEADAEDTTQSETESETDAETDEADSEIEELTDLEGVGDARAEDLREAGFESIDALREATADELASVEGVSADLAERIKNQVGG